MTNVDLQNALNAGGVITLPGGLLVLTQPLTITAQRGLHLVGASTKIQWQGPPNVPAISLLGCRQCVLEGFRLNGNAQYPIAEAIRFETLSGQVSTGNVLRDIDIDGTTAPGLGIGVRWVAGTGGDANNDFTTLECVRVANYTGCAFSIEHSQSVGHRFQGCHAEGNHAGLRGLQILSGSAQWRDGGLSGHTDTDFYLQGLARPMLVDGADSEGSNRFLIAYGPTGAPYRLSLRGCRAAGDRLNVDGRIVILESPGPVEIDACAFGDGWQGQGVWPQIGVNPGKPLCGRMSGCEWHAHGTFAGIPDGACNHPSVHQAGAGLGDFALQGNLYADAGGSAVVHVGPEIG